jgi:predicted MFS family arabinose efflux permease
VCLATLESALFAEALWLFLVATVAGGVAVGFIFRGGLSELNRLADPGRRAAVVATFFVAAYLARSSLPMPNRQVRSGQDEGRRRAGRAGM